MFTVDTIKLAIAGAVVAGAFAAGAVVSNWRSDKQIAELKAEYARQVSAAASDTLTVQRALNHARDAQAKREAAIDTDQTEKLRLANAETDRLRTCIADGTCGLRIRTACPATPSDVPRATPGARVDSGAGTELAPDARQYYFALRGAIAASERKLAACQDILRGRQNVDRAALPAQPE